MGVQTIVIRDGASGAEAEVLAGFGFNCFRFRVPVDGQRIDAIWSEPGFENGDKRASGSGIPILFPYPGRLRGKTLNWNGREYRLEGDDGRGNAIHGFVHTRPWRVVEQSECRVVGQFAASVDAPELSDSWPVDFRVTAAYEVIGQSLQADYEIENTGSEPMPCGFGLHPYFYVPLGGGQADACRVQVPASGRWELSDMLPTGKLLPLDSPESHRSGLPFGEMAFDDVFTGLDSSDGVCTCRVIDPNSGRKLEVAFDDTFSQCVVYNPPHREAICIEPYTCVPNYVELHEAGVDAGLRVLQPRDSFKSRMVIRVA